LVCIVEEFASSVIIVVVSFIVVIVRIAYAGKWDSVSRQGEGEKDDVPFEDRSLASHTPALITPSLRRRSSSDCLLGYLPSFYQPA